MRIVLMGPPGAGKGTQAVVLAAALGVPHISTGDIFRSNVSGGTKLGQLAKTFMDAGEYVPDTVTNDMVRDRISQQDALEGFVLDGYPRTVAQVIELDNMLATQGHLVDSVIELEVDKKAVVERLLQRAAEQNRVDDSKEVLEHRLGVYAEQTAPLITAYQARGLLRSINGMGSVDQVKQRLLAAVGL